MVDDDQRSPAATLPFVANTARIGFVGLGEMGGAMAARLIDCGWNLTLYARRAANLEPFAGTSARVAATLAELGAAVDVLCVCVVDAEQVEEVLFGLGGAAETLASGTVVVLHSTVAPEASAAFARRLEEQAIGYLDAPVTGGVPRARAGDLAIPVGGDPAVLDRCAALLNDESSTVVRAGDVGSGQLVKLLNNGMFAVQLSLADEVARLADAMRVSRDAVYQILRSGSAASYAFTEYVNWMTTTGLIFSGPSSYPGGRAGIMRKDLDLLGARLCADGLEEARFAGLVAECLDRMTDITQ